MRSKGPGTLYIEFRDHLSKFAKWPNSAHFVKLTVGRKNILETSSIQLFKEFYENIQNLIYDANVRASAI